MIENEMDILLEEVKIKLQKLKEYRDLGVPIRKLREYTTDIKIKLMRWIKSQRYQKLSYQQIEDKLNSRGVLTLSGRTRWDTRTISKIEKGKY